mmetsp:Transcript_18652/g.38128  ORF Transcript_18652/g.38128 Transcript_18652/m.38128 type:complete len:525 (+) Transcript_18652:233-1807(+)
MSKPNHDLYDNGTEGASQLSQKAGENGLAAASTSKHNAYQAFRPRLLYCPLFAWSAVTAGKFIAVFLQQLSPQFSDNNVGMTLSGQYAITSFLAGWGGSLADATERKCENWGCGRLKVTSLGVLLGTLSFLGHDLPQYINFRHLQEMINFPGDIQMCWHIMMRCITAVSLAIVAPSLDGLALAHLNCIEGSSQSEFGIERMYGAVFWGAGSLAAGIGIDHYGFGFLYVLVVVTALASYASMVVYLVSIQQDSTNKFSKKNFLKPESNDPATISCQSINSPESGGSDDTRQKLEAKSDVPAFDLFLLICNEGYGKAIIFFVFTLATGISVVDNLAFIYFDFLGSSNTMNGCTVVFTVLFELPLFYLAPFLLKHHGPGRLLLYAGGAYVVRVLGYTIVPEGHMGIILMLETLHGISYANLKTGSVEFVSLIVPKGSEATGQGILIFVNYLGVVVGLAFGGWLQEISGPRVMYACMGLIAFFGIAVLLLAETCCAKGNSSEKIRSENNIRQIGEYEHLCGNKVDRYG